MASVTPLHRPPAPEPPALHVRAMDNLAFIRDTMEAAGSFTAVSGWGMVAVGIIATVAATIAAAQQTEVRSLYVWIVAAVLAPVVMLWAIVRKARRAHVPLLSGPGRKFVLSFSPPVLVGALLTIVLYRAGLVGMIPGHVASPLWDGRRGRRRVFREDRAGDGNLLHARRYPRLVRSSIVERLDHGGGVRRSSHRIRNSRCVEARWLSTEQRATTGGRA